jgi:GNAT superfamily N-acetyltransferase
MARHVTASGYGYDSADLDRVERLFWRECWESAGTAAAADHGVELRDFGPVQAQIIAALPEVGMMNLALGATAPGAVGSGHLADAVAWMSSRGVAPHVPVGPGLAESEAVETWLASNGFEPGYAWMKFVRDSHPPRFRPPAGVEVVELTSPEQAPFGMIVATGFGAPPWAAALFSELPGRAGWRCYVAQIDGTPQACAAMRIDGGIAEFGLAATLEPARGRGCQLALLHQRISDAAAEGCRLLFVETGERVPDRPSASYRNILRAGFEEAYLRPNWKRARRA